MTPRTEANPPTQIELATSQVVADLSASITTAWRMHKPAIPEKQFRSILAGYFESKSIADWCQDFGIEPSEGEKQASQANEKRR